MNNKDSGYILVSILFVIAFLGLLFSKISMHHHYMLSSRYEEIHTSRALERAKQGPAKSIKLFPSGLRQVTLSGTSGKMKSSLVVHQFESTTSSFPDFNKLSVYLTMCNDIKEFHGTHTQNGERLTPSAFQSPLSCNDIALSTDREQIYFYTENLELPALQTSETVIITSTGFMSIQNLILKGDTSLFAAGDIVIEVTQAPDIQTLWLYSASGIIHLKSVPQNIQIKAYAAEGVYLPAGHSPPQPLTPSQYLKGSLLLGMR